MPGTSAAALSLEVVDKRGFPNTGLPGDKNNLPLIPERPLQGLAQFIEHLFPAHKFAVRSGCSSETLDQFFADRSNESISSPLRRFNETRTFGVVSQDPSDLRNMAFQDFRLNVYIGPEPLEQFILSH